MAGRKKAAVPAELNALFKSVEGFKSPQGLTWSSISLTMKDGIKYAIVEVDGLAFAFTSEPDLCIFADSTSEFSANEILGTVKKYGNHSDFEFSFKVSGIVDTELVNVPLDEIRANIVSVPQRFNIGGTAQAKVASMNWEDVADKLVPFAESIQTLFKSTAEQSLV